VGRVDPSEHPGRAIVLGAGMIYGALEATFGLALVLATSVRGHPPTAWLDAVKSVSRADVGAFGPRWLVHATAGLARSQKLLVGVGLAIEGAVRTGLLIGVARGQRTVTAVAAVVFGAAAIGGLVVAGLNPPVGSFVTAGFNVAVAAAIALELRELLTDQSLRARRRALRRR